MRAINPLAIIWRHVKVVHQSAGSNVMYDRRPVLRSNIDIQVLRSAQMARVVPERKPTAERKWQISGANPVENAGISFPLLLRNQVLPCDRCCTWCWRHYNPPAVGIP